MEQFTEGESTREEINVKLIHLFLITRHLYCRSGFTGVRLRFINCSILLNKEYLRYLLQQYIQNQFPKYFLTDVLWIFTMKV